MIQNCKINAKKGLQQQLNVVGGQRQLTVAGISDI